MTPLLDVQNLRVVLRGRAATPVLHGLSFALMPGETLAVVGESGCGKSATALAIMRLLPPPLRTMSGRVLFEGQDLLRLPPRAMRRVRGGRIGMVFQEPMTSLNPAIPVGAQVAEILRAHGVSAAAARRRAVELLDLVRIPEPHFLARAHPHRLSGGQRQRVVIATAIACRPALLIADEPTTALDVTTQHEIMELLSSLRTEMGSAVLLVTHNLGLVAQFADRVMVMYAGRKVEEAGTAALFRDPRHPYTSGLLLATPDPARPRPPGGLVLRDIPGTVPPLSAMPPGCAFAPRCGRAVPRCGTEHPALASTPGGLAACFVDA